MQLLPDLCKVVGKVQLLYIFLSMGNGKLSVGSIFRGVSSQDCHR